MLALSSLSKSARYVGILYAGITFFTSAIYGALYAITGSSRVSWISIGANVKQVVDVVFRLKPRYATPVAGVLLVVLALVVALGLDPRAARARRGGGDVSAPIVTADHVSKWYGQVIGLNDVSVIAAAGRDRPARPQRRRQVDVHEAHHRPARPSKGEVRVLGEPIWRNPRIYFQIGFCPEQDAFYDRMTGLEWVTRAGAAQRPRREGSRRGGAAAR